MALKEKINESVIKNMEIVKKWNL